MQFPTIERVEIEPRTKLFSSVVSQLDVRERMRYNVFKNIDIEAIIFVLVLFPSRYHVEI